MEHNDFSNKNLKKLIEDTFASVQANTKKEREFVLWVLEPGMREFDKAMKSEVVRRYGKIEEDEHTN